MSKRTLDAFFTLSSPAKKPKTSSPTASAADAKAFSSTTGNPQGVPLEDDHAELADPSPPPSNHATYPHPIADLPVSILSILETLPATPSKPLPPRANLDTLYFTPFIPRDAARRLYTRLLSTLPFYRVKYTITRGSSRTSINTPRYTTVFGVDDSARFAEDGSLVTTVTKKTISGGTYRRSPRPLPACLDHLRLAVEKVTKERYNFCLVNYYQNGDDSISFHSDDERFLGRDPCIASLSLGGTRDFHLKPKPAESKGPQDGDKNAETIKLTLENGDMIVMRGPTQANWLHAIPKRKGEQGKKGRINITFRRAMIKQGTDNYYNYNVGDGSVWRWSEQKQQMQLWDGNAGAGDQADKETQVNWR